jgi:hypothetical protein
MAAGLWVFLTGLRVVAGTPDALCPTPAEAEAVIQARVGEVVGGSYTATYTIVRDPDRERELVRLVLTEDGGGVVLDRAIPLGAGGCSEAAQAMALILERHFQSLETPSEPAPGAAPPVEPTTTSAPSITEATEPRREVAKPKSEPNSARSLHAPPAPTRPTPEPERKVGTLRAGIGVREAPMAIGQLGVELRSDATLALSLDAVFSLDAERATELDHELSSQQFGLELGASWLVPVGRHFELGIGPLVGVRLEIARLEENEEIATGSQNRYLPHVGLQALARYELGRIFHLDLTARGARVLTGQTTGFEIVRPDGESVEVLAPRQWLAEGVLSLGVRF